MVKEKRKVIMNTRVLGQRIVEMVREDASTTMVIYMLVSGLRASDMAMGPTSIVKVTDMKESGLMI